MLIAIIGGSAAGLTAAISAARTNKSSEVIIFERLDRVGKKILATGNGRCNLTNNNLKKEGYYGKDPSFAESILKQYPKSSITEFFGSIGVVCISEGDKVFPRSLQASSVLDSLRLECARLNIKEKCQSPVLSLEKQNEKFILTTENEIIKADRVIVAAGGKASPALGSDGSGYALLTGLGHTLSPLFPWLLQIKTEPLKALFGIKFEGRATAVIDGKPKRQEQGEILFTDNGLSGPPIFNLSRLAGEYQGKMAVSLDFFPEYAEKDLAVLLFERRETLKERELEYFFTGLANKKIGMHIMKYSNTTPLSRKVSSLSDKEISLLAGNMKSYEMKVTGIMPWQNAQITAGGILTKDFSEKTMESNLVSCLYAAGEILDIDGECGGYNLHFAFATGLLAGKNAAE